MGENLHNLAKSEQCLLISHLPQVAGFASSHYSVKKQISKSKTKSTVQILESDEELIDEFSRMIGKKLSLGKNYESIKNMLLTIRKKK